MANAQLTTKIIYYYNSTSGDIRIGLPERFPAPYGYEKIVCNTAHEAEVWSERMRRWENWKEQLKDEERELIEGPIREQLRSDIRHQMVNARNPMNREFLRRHLELYDKRADLTKSKRESYLHAEAFERGRD